MFYLWSPNTIIIVILIFEIVFLINSLCSYQDISNKVISMTVHFFFILLISFSVIDITEKNFGP